MAAAALGKVQCYSRKGLTRMQEQGNCLKKLDIEETRGRPDSIAYKIESSLHGSVSFFFKFFNASLVMEGGSFNRH